MMVEWGDLPDEIVVSIVSRIHGWNDLYRLSAVSRRLQLFVSPFLAKSKLYRYLDFEDRESCTDQPGSDHYRSLLYSILVSILNSPEIALYVEVVCLEWNYREDNFRFDIAEEEVRSLLELIFEKTGILGWKGGKDLTEALRDGEQEAYVALLLLLLGNLESLQISVKSDDKWVPWAIRKVASADAMPSCLPGLRSLRQVDIFWNSDYRWDEEISLYSVAPFLLLPSIDRIEANIVSHLGDFNWEGAYGTSTVTSLSFVCSSINVKALEELLRIPKSLKLFWYWYTDYDEDDDADCDEDYAEFMKVVGRNHISLVDCTFQVRRAC